MNTRRGNQFIPAAAFIMLVASGADRAAADALTLVWSQTYSGQGRAEALGVAVDNDAVYATGNTSPTPGSPTDLILLKYDLAGNPVWSRTWPGSGGSGYDGGRQVAIASTGVFVAGSTDEYATWLRDAVTLKYSTDGVLDTSNSPQGWWTKFSGDTSYHGYNGAGDVAFDEAGNMYVVGNSERAYNNIWTYVQKYNAAGSLQWHQNYGAFGVGGNGSLSIVRRGDALYTAGHSGRGVDEQILSLKYSTAGTRLWDTSWGGADSDRGFALDVLGDDLFITGWLGSDLVLLKLHDNGSSVSYVADTTFSGPGTNIGYGIKVTNDMVYIAGSTSVGSQTDALLLAYDTDLNLLWSYSWGGTGNDSANDVTVHNGILYVAGTLGNQAFVYAYCVRGDLNCDGLVNGQDIDGFTLALTDPTAYQTAFPNCNILTADCNGDGLVNEFDIAPFIALLIGG